MISWIVGFVAWTGCLICVVGLCRSAADEEAPAPPVAPPWALGEYGPLPPGDGCSISDYYFEMALD